MEIKDTVKSFLQKKIGEEIAFTYDDDIFKLGLVNSLFALELVVFLETTFGLSVENDDLNLENFNQINNIEKFVQRKKGITA